MATNSKRDVELGISVTTAGSEGIKRLKDEVEALAKQGGAAAPEFNKLADELDRLGQQATALEAFDQIGRDIEALALAENNARKATSDLSTELSAATQKADGFRTAQADALKELRDAQQALTQSRIELANYKNSTEAAEASTEVYQAKVRELTQAVIEGRRALSDKAVAFRNSREATREAEAEESKLEKAYNRSATEARNTTTALAQREQALRDQKKTLTDLGVETENLRAVDVSLINAINAVQVETNDLVTAQTKAAEAARRMADEEERLAAEAKAAAQSYVNFWIDALNRREEAEKATAAATKAAADQAKASAAAIQNALGTVGVKSAEELRLEIQQVRDSLKLLGDSGTLTGRELDTAMNVGQRRINELERQIREATGQLTLMDKAAGLLKTTIGRFAAFISLTEIVQRLGRGFFDAAKQIEGLRLALGQIYGSADTAGKQIDFLRQTANVAGISIGSISDAFVKFSASMRGANVPLEQSNALFGAVSRAAGVLGLSGDKLNHILDALSQIAAKGVVSMEELRQQLGDSLPGALSLAAKGLGLTESQLIKLVESGGLLAQDLIPALTKSLQGLGGEVNTLNSAWGRLKNATTATFQAIGDAGVITVLTGALKAAKAALDFFGLGLVTLIEMIRLAFEGTGTFIGVLIGSGSISEALQAAGEKSDEAGKRLLAYRNALFEGTAAAGSFTEQMNGVTRGTAEQEAALAKTTATIKAQTQASVSQGVATQAAALQATLASQSWVQLGVALETLRKENENNILVSDKFAKAKETEGKASVEMAKLTGDETQVREASTKAATENATALQNVAVTRERDLAQQIAYRDELIEEARRLGDSTGARAQAITAISQRISALAAEAERARQSADESRNNAIAIALEASAVNDNSGNLTAFTALRAQARAELEATIEAEKRGVLTQKDVKAATEQLAVIESLYRDALRDTTQQIENRITVMRASFSVTQAHLELDRAQVERSIDLAKQLGNEYGVRQGTIKLKELDIKVARAKVEATKAEADATIAKAEADAAELTATGQMTTAKKADIDARIANARAKQLEAAAGAERIKILEDELKRLRLYGDEGYDAGRRIKESMDKARGSVESVGKAASGAADDFRSMASAAASVKYNRYASPGDPTNQAIDDAERAKRLEGNSGWADNSGMFLIEDKLNKGTLTSADLSLAKTVYDVIQNNRRMFESSSPGLRSLDGITDNAKWSAIGSRLRDWIALNGGADGAKVSQMASTSAQSTAATTAQSSSSVKTIRLQFGNTSTDVNVASASDAARLESFLTQIAAAKGTAV